MKICVVGAGIIGTSSAIRLKKAFPHSELDLISQDFSPQTTSDGSGGFWQPHLLQDTPETSVKKWSRDTFHLCENLWRGNSCKDTQGLEEMKKAVSLVPCYDLMSANNAHEKEDWQSIVYDYRWLDATQTTQLGFAPRLVGHSFLSYVYEPGVALPIMYDWLKRQPCTKLVQRKLKSLDQLQHEDYDLVVNCTGPGAKYFVNDDNLKPISGHVLRVSAPWAHFVMAAAEDVYVIPNRDALVVGSINKFNNWDRSIDAIDGKDARFILNRCAEQLYPRLKDAEILGQWIGLRPFRVGGVRLEHEIFNGKLNVIHNYGHGGCGVTLSWGCAGEVVELAKSLMRNKSLL